MSDPQTPLTVGLHAKVPAARYHADPTPAPSLSSGIARTIYGQSLAHAYLQHPRLGGKPRSSTAAMDLGSVVHAMLAGEQDGFEVGNFDNFRTNSAKEWRAKVEASGKVAVLPCDLDEAKPIVEAVRKKAALGLTRDPFKTGQHEMTAIWQEGDAWLRARYDLLDLDEGAYADIWDWKTTTTVEPEKLVRKIIDEGYHMQAAHYLKGLRKILPRFAGRTSFILVFVEVAPPYAVRRVVMSEGFLSIANMQLARATDQWKQAMQTNEWPDNSGSTLTAEPPAWFTSKFEDIAI